MLHNNHITSSLTFFCFNNRPNGRITEYLLYHNNQMVYRGKDRQHNITGNECVGACVCVVAVTVEGWRHAVRRRVKKSKVEWRISI